MSNKDNTTIIPEIEMAENLCFAALSQLANSKTITIDETHNVLDMARSLINLCLIKAKKEGTLNVPPSRKDEAPVNDKPSQDRKELTVHAQSVAGNRTEVKRNKHRRNCNKISERVVRRIESIQHMFNAFAMMEMFLAKQEDRQVNEPLMRKMAVRIARAVLKDVKDDIDVEKISVDVYRDQDGFSVEIVMPKHTAHAK